MPDLELLATLTIDLAPDARNLLYPLWVSPCGRFVAYPAGGTVAVLALGDAGITEHRRVPLPEGAMLRSLPKDHGASDGIQCGAVGVGGAPVAIASDAQVDIEGDAGGWRSLTVLPTEDELASGAISDEEARWLGEPDAVAFDRGGGLWLAGTHVEGNERITRIDPVTAGLLASTDLPDSYPDPIYVTIDAVADGLEIAVDCGQDGSARCGLGFDGGAIAVRPIAAFGDPVIDPLAALRHLPFEGAALYRVDGGALTLGAGDEWGVLRLYRVTP